MYWGEQLRRSLGEKARVDGVPLEDYVAQKATSDDLLQALRSAAAFLKLSFGSWQTAWGEINRFQRTTSDIVAAV